jgi:hypothetical protein
VQEEEGPIPQREGGGPSAAGSDAEAAGADGPVLTHKLRARMTVSDQWSRGGGAMAISCWAGCHETEMNRDNFDLFKQFQINLN